MTWFHRFGVWTIFFGRLVPLIRSLISIPAGMSRMNMGVFLLFTTIGTLIWNTILVSVGAAVGASWSDIVGYMDIYSNVVYLILAVLIVLFLVFYIKKKGKAKLSKNKKKKIGKGVFRCDTLFIGERS